MGGNLTEPPGEHFLGSIFHNLSFRIAGRNTVDSTEVYPFHSQ